MKGNISIWGRYQPNFVDDMFVPYLRDTVRDGWGNIVKINPWEKQGCMGVQIEPELVRVNKGLTFQRMFDTDPCPSGFKKAPNSYCVREPLKGEPIFYTDKAFIAKKQFWSGYGEGNNSPRRVSEQTDLRSVNPLTGLYTIYYNPSQWSSNIRYSRPVIDTEYQYDRSWNLPAERGYEKVSTSDSYL